MEAREGKRDRSRVKKTDHRQTCLPLLSSVLVPPASRPGPGRGGGGGGAPASGPSRVRKGAYWDQAPAGCGTSAGPFP